MSFGKNLRRVRQDAGMTQEQLAELLNVSPQAVSRWENESSMPDIALLAPIANTFSVSIDSLLDVDVRQNARRVAKIRNEARKLIFHATSPADYAEAERIIRQGLKLYPTNWELKNDLCQLLFIRHVGCSRHNTAEDDRLVALREMNTLCEEIIAGSDDQMLIQNSIYWICNTARELDNVTRAEELIRKIPSPVESPAELLAQLQTGEESRETRRQVIDHARDRICTQLHRLVFEQEGIPPENRYTGKEMLSLLRLGHQLTRLLYGEDDYRIHFHGTYQLQFVVRTGDTAACRELLEDDLALMEKRCREGICPTHAPLFPTDEFYKRDRKKYTSPDYWKAHCSKNIREDYLPYLDRLPEEMRNSADIRQIRARYAEFAETITPLPTERKEDPS